MRTFLFTRPRGNSLYFLHGELLCQGVSRAVLLASAKTHKKLRPRKQRTYRRSSLGGEFASNPPLRQQSHAYPSQGFIPASLEFDQFVNFLVAKTDPDPTITHPDKFCFIAER